MGRERQKGKREPKERGNKGELEERERERER